MRFVKYSIKSKVVDHMLKKITKLTTAAIIVLTIGGCANTDVYDGNFTKEQYTVSALNHTDSEIWAENENGDVVLYEDDIFEGVRTLEVGDKIEVTFCDGHDEITNVRLIEGGNVK